MALGAFYRMLADDHDHDHDHGHDPEHEEEEKLMMARIIMIIFILLAGLVILVPYSKFVRKSNENMTEQTDTKVCSGRLHQYSNCFASGMLLSLSLVHILPEALEAYTSYLKEHAKEEDHDGHDHRRRILSFFTRVLSETDKAATKTTEAKKEGHDEHEEGGFPLVFFLFVVGFLLMLFLDQVLFK